ncbi:MAG: NAD(P)/FAD-dependent oxidoreductase [Oscillospiraceae bacterium]|nr:NAD(P)/FAD-dependent oxidoreductase [Oscillospiraceae bacterium]
MRSNRVAVVGGGAAGLMAAITAARQGAAVTLLERNEKVGRKLYITGKSRCNLTNDCPWEDVLKHTTCNAKFLYSSMAAFPPGAAMEFFQSLGVPLKTERGRRVFPQSDRAADVVDALFRQLKREGVRLVQARAEGLLAEGGKIAGVETDRGRFPCDCAILATGGLSYPQTGSTGDGYAMARRLGHTVIPPKASLVPLCSDDPCCPRLQGLSLRNTGVSVKTGGGRTVFQEQGELLFTHFGLSGPTVLSASAHLRQWEGEDYTLVLDLKPALDREILDRRLLREVGESGNREVGTLLRALLPRSLGPEAARRAGLSMEEKAGALTRAQRRALLETLKGFSIHLTGPAPIEEAVVTAGGVKVSELDPKTMASRLVPGLYFAGELIDVDAYTGGYNLQIAWATGRAAGLAAAQAGEEGTQ